MKTLSRRLLIIGIIISFVCGSNIIYAAPAPATQKTTVSDKKKQETQKAKEKKQKEAQKAKAQKQREAEKAKAQKQKEADKKKKQQERLRQQQDAQRAKEQAARQQQNERKQAERAEAEAAKTAQLEAQKQAYLREQARLNDTTPRKEPISLFNLAAKLGYAAIMDKQNFGIPAISNPNKLNSDNPYNSLTGGAGAGFAATYELQYGAFRFETGLDFTFLNSSSNYGFILNREEQNHNAIYSYITSDLRETRNIGHIGIPVMFGAQFSRYYFMLGAKVGYGVFGNYKQKGLYEITVNDPALFEPYGLGIIDIPTQQQPKLSFKQPSLSLCAEIGLDLDEWLQASPARKQKRVKPGERLPFGRENIHYKVSAFAEYGILNTNNPSGSMPLLFDNSNAYLPTASASVLNLEGTKANNLFVGVKFAVQFEVPGKSVRPTPPPPSTVLINIVDADTKDALPYSIVKIHDTNTGKVALKSKGVKNGRQKQRVMVGTYEIEVSANDYNTTSEFFEIQEVGSLLPLTINMKHKPILRLRITDIETGEPLSVSAVIRQQGSTSTRYTLSTDSISGTGRLVVEDDAYTLHIEPIGYEVYDQNLSSLSEEIHVQLHPVKKGDVFVVQNLFFATNKTRILKTSEDALNALYQYLDSNKNLNVRIIGHTDNIGSDAANQRLSEGRADAVRDDLIKRGIAPERLQTEGRGESQPIDTNDTEEGRQNNRRVEIEIL
ncbi:MAG: OmpA family protein [Paludibacter sp.]|nr:OmpA family protein [Bacteroidales bacterium]MCM1069998.1 OmpA family protein [Prevotella sp.]MCM1354543.1 OmpA family protein [Bacteroides sp.]MCM1443620.1 OmpA family protein [Muribaculum sp.]MCM1482685.1 OmpA family protein [Paludibacter sp.]